MNDHPLTFFWSKYILKKYVIESQKKSSHAGLLSLYKTILEITRILSW